MADLVKALAPAFAAGFAVQQFLEIIDPVLTIFFSGDIRGQYKKPVLGLLSLVIGVAVAVAGKFRVLHSLGVSDADVADIIVTGLIISAGTEGFNSIMKFMGYAKDGKKADASASRAVAPAAGGAASRPPAAGVS